jgi:hypothetical protein
MHASELATYEMVVIEHFADMTAWTMNAVYRVILIACSVSDNHGMLLAFVATKTEGAQVELALSCQSVKDAVRLVVGFADRLLRIATEIIGR